MLRLLVAHASLHVPHYRRRFREAGLDPEGIRTLDDLERIPVTTKRDLQAAGAAETLSEGVDPAACITLHTSGSTGTPLAIHLTRWEWRVRSLVELRSLRAIGFSARDHIVSLGPQGQRPPSPLDRLGVYRTTIIPGALAPAEQLRRLESLAPTVLWSYPSFLRSLRQAAGRPLGDFARPRLLVTSAEMLDELLRAQLVADFAVDPYNFYGSLEIGRIAAECPAREGLHVNTDHVILESRNGDRPAGEDEPGTVLVTALNARAMPFIRYRLGDRVVRLSKPCSCGSPFPLIAAPLGREGDIIALPSGRIVSPFWCFFVLRRHLDILRFRIIQERVDHLTVLLVTQSPWPESTLAELRREVLDQIGEPVTIDVRVVDAIPEEKDKFRSFVSRLSAAPGG